EESEELLFSVGIQEPDRCLRAYPHQLSGGMRQRVLIAAALSCKPVLLICDEITSSVDSIVQSQLLTLLGEVKNRFHTSILLITHNLRATRHLADRLVVLFQGQIVEEGNTDQIFDSPAHAFTRSLISSLPNLEPR
ncbi:MAG: ATP-binding cassette domain-containing protein, partial [bacterium]